MLTAIHNHFNARKICELDLAQETISLIETPPPLKDNWVDATNPLTGAPMRVNNLQAEDHIVRIPSPYGELILFKILVNGKPLVATPTPDIALAMVAA